MLSCGWLRFIITSTLHICVPLLFTALMYSPETTQVSLKITATGHEGSGFNALWIYYIILGAAFRGVWAWLGDLFDD